MEEMKRHGEIGKASMRAGMDRKTGRKYATEGKLPSELVEPRGWRTRPDPFVEDWAAIAARLKDAPELEAKTLFEDLLAREPERYDEGQLRTLQRHVQQWRAQEGPPREVFFAQEHRAGEAMQTDFTWGTELEITIQGGAYAHLLCHPVLPYSNWEWVTVCQSESMAALRRGVQQALFKLGRHPEFHQTDNSTAATHDLRTGKRGFNAEYEALMGHLGMKPRTIQVGESHQNGDVEALNGALKRRVKQHLLLRQSRDFESVEAYEAWLQRVLEKANGLRDRRFQEDLAAMRPLEVAPLPEYTTEDVGVTSWSTIRVKHNAYSVPSRLIGEAVRVRIYDERIEVYYGNVHQFTVERLHGRQGHRIDYRHIIWSLVQKPGAFARYRYREELFPSLVFRRAYDALSEGRAGRDADLEYLRVLHFAASTMESEVAAALELLLEQGIAPIADEVKALVTPARADVPALTVPEVDLAGYDGLLESACMQEVAA
jgi:hypothetical protein